MSHFRLHRPLTVVSAVAVLVFAAGCSKPADNGPAGSSPAAPGQASATSQAKSASRLGDLSAFRTIAADVATMVDKGDLPAAKARIKDLEIAWDSAEAGLKPRAATDWHVIDKSIDRALTALRDSKPSQADCKKAMADLLATLDSYKGAS